LERTDKLKQSATKQGIDCNFIVFNPTNLTYFTNFSGATALLIPQQGQAVLYVSGVNFEQAKEETNGLTVQLLKRGENLFEKIANHTSTKKFAVDSLPVESWRALAKVVGGEDNLQSANSLIREVRAVKDTEEIELIREACKLASIGMKVASETIRAGLAEKTLAAEVEYAMRKAGSDGVAFDTIVASGAYSAFPHGCSREKTISESDLVLVDLGAIYNFYRSDLTRTFVAGKASEKQARIYENVRLAQQKAIQAIKPKVPARMVDSAARQVLETKESAELCVHNIGHGVGLEVHEAPILSPESSDVLEAGNVLTVEPGVYVPGFGGVRIEDTVLVTRGGAEKLTLSPYTLEV
jgi:Xaa-Pro dipeptidase